MESFAKLINHFKPLTIFAKRSILDVWLSEYSELVWSEVAKQVFWLTTKLIFWVERF